MLNVVCFIKDYDVVPQPEINALPDCAIKNIVVGEQQNVCFRKVCSCEAIGTFLLSFHNNNKILYSQWTRSLAYIFKDILIVICYLLGLTVSRMTPHRLNRSQGKDSQFLRIIVELSEFFDHILQLAMGSAAIYQLNLIGRSKVNEPVAHCTEEWQSLSCASGWRHMSIDSWSGHCVLDLLDKVNLILLHLVGEFKPVPVDELTLNCFLTLELALVYSCLKF